MSMDPRNVMAWTVGLGVPVAATVVVSAFLTMMPFEVMQRIVEAHFAAIVGLPIAAIFAVFLVVALQQASGPVKFEGLGFKFEGTSGQVVLWVFCFLSIAGAIKLLWVP